MYRDAIILAGAFCKMCLLKRRPQDLPASRELLLLTIAIYFLLDFLLAKLDENITSALTAALTDTVFLLVFTLVLLLLCRKAGRWTQTVTALAGTGVVFALLLMPAVISLSGPDAMTAMQQALSVLLYLVLIWYVVVLGHIFRHALSSPFAMGVFVSMIYLLIGVFIELTLVYPDS